MTSTSAHVKNPSLSTEGLPKKRGETQVVNRQLEYLNPMTDEWEPAVRLHDIRRRVLRGNGQQYNIPKKHGNVLGQELLNYTSFLARDQAYGPLRCNRNPILFQLKPTDFGVEPTDYVRDNGNIVLDAFDHGIRDFGDAMPLCLSTEVEGHDIETYKRRNMKIAMYDIIARMPGSYWTGRLGQTWRDKPPRAGSVSMRATRFRLRAGCLVWNEKGDSEAKNSAMMSIMPPAVRTVCENSNSTSSFRDLSKSEQTQCETATGHRPGKASKVNRAKKEAENQSGSIHGDDVKQEDEAEAGGPEEEGYGEEASRAAVRPTAEPTSRKGLGRGHANAKKRTRQDDSTSDSKQMRSNNSHKRSRYQTYSDEEDAEEQPPTKHRRTGKGPDPEEPSSEYEPAFVERPAGRRHTSRAQAQVQTSGSDAESALIFEEAIASALKFTQPSSNIGNMDGLEYLNYDEERDAEGDSPSWISNNLTRGTSFEDEETRSLTEIIDEKGAMFATKQGAHLLRGHPTSGSTASDQSDDQALRYNTIPEEETRDGGAEEEADVITASRTISKRMRRSIAQKAPRNTKLADTMRLATRRTNSPELVGAAPNNSTDRRKLKHAVRRDAQNKAPYAGNGQLPLPDASSSFADNALVESFVDFGDRIPDTSLDQFHLPEPLTSLSENTQISQGSDRNDVASYLNFPETSLSAVSTDAYPLPDGFDPLKNTYADNGPQPTEHGGHLDFVNDEVDLNAPDIALASSPTEVSFDPTCEGFLTEVATGIEAGDYRYVTPMSTEDIKLVERVLELSRADYFQKTGHHVPRHVVDDYKGETYASQQRRLDAHFESERIEAGNYDGESIYCLPEWFGGFNRSWRSALDEEGIRLEDDTQDYDF